MENCRIGAMREGATKLQDFYIFSVRRMIPGKIACEAGMPNDEWITTLADGRRVKFTNQELADSVFVTAQIEGNRVVYSVVLTNIEKPLNRAEVESYFDGELQRSSNSAHAQNRPDSQFGKP